MRDHVAITITDNRVYLALRDPNVGKIADELDTMTRSPLTTRPGRRGGRIAAIPDIQTTTILEISRYHTGEENEHESALSSESLPRPVFFSSEFSTAVSTSLGEHNLGVILGVIFALAHQKRRMKRRTQEVYRINFS